MVQVVPEKPCVSITFRITRLPAVEVFGEKDVQCLSDLAEELVSLLEEELVFESEVLAFEGTTLLLASVAR